VRLSASRSRLDTAIVAQNNRGRGRARQDCKLDVDLRGAQSDGLGGIGSMRGAIVDVGQLVELLPSMAM